MIYITSSSSFFLNPCRSSLFYLAYALQLSKKRTLNKIIDRAKPGFENKEMIRMFLEFLNVVNFNINKLPLLLLTRWAHIDQQANFKIDLRHGS